MASNHWAPWLIGVVLPALLSSKKLLRTSLFSGLTAFSVTICPPSFAAANKFANSAGSNISDYAEIILIVIGTCLLMYKLLSKLMSRIQHRRHQLNEQLVRLNHSLNASGDEWWEWDIAKQEFHRGHHWDYFPDDGLRSDDHYTAGTIHPKDLPRVRKALNEHIQGGSDQFQITYRLKGQHSDSWFWVLDRGRVVGKDNQGHATRMAGTLSDINHLMQSKDQHLLFSHTLENISDAVVILDKAFKAVDVNQAFCKITGYQKEQLTNWQFAFDRYPQQFTEQLKQTLKSTGRWFGELEANRANGDIFQIELTIDAVSDDEGQFTHYVGVFSDITQRKNTERELRKLANSDTLTELPNRSLFYANHKHMVRRTEPHALLVFDLDDFKKVNDSLGHHAGDQVLCAVARRLKRCCRSQDTLYRLGGDEFAIVIEGSNSVSTLTEVAKRAMQTLNDPFTLQGSELFVTSSIGIAMYPLDGESTEELLKKADIAMYYAKNQGANRYQFFSESMNEQAIKRLHLESLMRQALKEGMFEVHYQPQYSVERQQMVGMEALVRLRHPEQGLIFPGDFMPLAEESGLIIDIGNLVLEQACKTVQQWRDIGLYKGHIAINLSAKELDLDNFSDHVEAVLAKTGLPANALELEITESSVMQSPKTAVESMQALRRQGIMLALDDFGTGYSSLAYLKKFPITTLKIDRTFVMDLESSLEDRQMANAIITIAHNLGLEVIAEGVETHDQLKILSAMSCDVCQGYYFSKPLSQRDMTTLLSTQQGNLPIELMETAPRTA
ncbi:EAL domain-containing protein [Corallincola spongiicola]|uniref:EAL domain-containing protein n=2 Tax=Corallincola spongiicola TaxID=2520508 RepID=A0ABY1WMZ7_9GAMM|nr:EAL domain-containing protein [Corallincola spongiicola]